MTRLTRSFPGFDAGLLTNAETDELEKLLAFSKHYPPQLEDIWRMMDRVWDSYGCDNMNPDWEKIGRFYQHPVWLLNGLFVEQHPESIQHRKAIVSWITSHEREVQTVLDYGGGFGTLARLIAQQSPACRVDIFELHPSRCALLLAQPFDNIRFVGRIPSASRYDCVVSTDVIEHVSEPVYVLQEIVSATAMHGYLVLANNFFPVIKCHLPQTFHFRFSFNLFARLVGLAKIGQVYGSHATAFQRVSGLRVGKGSLQCFEVLSRGGFPCFKLMHILYKQLRRFSQ